MPADALTLDTSIETEWLLTAVELCGLLDATHDVPALQINPSLARPEVRQSVTFKGGSEPGVLHWIGGSIPVQPR